MLYVRKTSSFAGMTAWESLRHGVRAKFRTNMAPNAKSSMSAALSKPGDINEN
jgi:hypothetical protein